MRKAIVMLAEFSTYYWVLLTIAIALAGPGVQGALAGYVLFLAFKTTGRLKLPVAASVLKDRTLKLVDAIEWNGGVAVVRLRVCNKGGIKIRVSGTVLTFVSSLVVALMRLGIPPLKVEELVALASLLFASAAFYRASARYVKDIGVAVPVLTSSAYAIAVNIATWLIFRSAEALYIATFVNFLSILIGCDMLVIGSSMLSGARAFVIGGLGIYDALIFLPTFAHLVTFVAIASVSSLL